MFLGQERGSDEVTEAICSIAGEGGLEDSEKNGKILGVAELFLEFDS